MDGKHTGAHGSIPSLMATEKAAPRGRFHAVAYAAAGWAFLFASMSFYWALGGRASLSTQALAIQDRIDNPEFIAVLWVTGALKVVAAVVALAFVLPLGRRIPRRSLLFVGWATAVLLLVYGGLGWMQALLWETGVQDIPISVGAKASRWKVIFWDPFWILGGLLFLFAVREFQSRGRPAAP